MVVAVAAGLRPLLLPLLGRGCHPSSSFVIIAVSLRASSPLRLRLDVVPAPISSPRSNSPSLRVRASPRMYTAATTPPTAKRGANGLSGMCMPRMVAAQRAGRLRTIAQWGGGDMHPGASELGGGETCIMSVPKTWRSQAHEASGLGAPTWRRGGEATQVTAPRAPPSCPPHLRRCSCSSAAAPCMLVCSGHVWHVHAARTAAVRVSQNFPLIRLLEPGLSMAVRGLRVAGGSRRGKAGSVGRAAAGSRRGDHGYSSLHPLGHCNTRRSCGHIINRRASHRVSQPPEPPQLSSSPLQHLLRPSQQPASC
ncbi:unnamed protein product [Closterium sp. NIES-54]